jgi:adenylosuccinate lyase
MEYHPINSISPADGRYYDRTRETSTYFSEFALIKYRVYVEIQYFVALVKLPLDQLKAFPTEKITDIIQIFEQFSTADALRIKEIERTTNHDVKAVEYFLKEKFELIGVESFSEFIHFGLTSQDINNTATGLFSTARCIER